LGRFGRRNGCSENNGAKGGRESWMRQNGESSWEEWERLLGRMGGNAATDWEGYLEEQERILGKVGVNIETHWEGCLEEWERILGRRGVNAATFREDYCGS